jgi:molybdopterin-binding protein
MKLSTRNILKGTITRVIKGKTTAYVQLELWVDIFASITNGPVNELGLRVGMQAAAVIKASDVIIAID